MENKSNHRLIDAPDGAKITIEYELSKEHEETLSDESKPSVAALVAAATLIFLAWWILYGWTLFIK